jgi:predicted transcriptional regulator
MSPLQSILISVHVKHVENMLAGRKTVELRRRVIRVIPGTRVWIYCTHPMAQVLVTATITEIVTASPKDIWDAHGARSGLLRSEFDSYFDRANTACAIMLSDIKRLKAPLTLKKIRENSKRFHPPQFFKKITPACPEFVLLDETQI